MLLILMGLMTVMGLSSREADQKDALIPRKVLFGNPEKASPQLSPDGKNLAYLAPDENNVLNVWIRDLGQSDSQDRMVTSDRKRGIRNYLWQFDNQHILFIQDCDGDENGHLYQTDITTKETKDLTPYSGVKADIIAYYHSFPNEILVQINRRNKALFDVYRINLQTAQCELDTENIHNSIHWVSDHQLHVRAQASYNEDGGVVIRVRDSISSPWRTLLTLDPDETEGDAGAFSADDQSLLAITSLEGKTARLLKVDLVTGKKEVLAEDPQYDLSHVMVHPTTHALEAVAVERERLEWILLDKGLAQDFERLQRLFPENTFRIVSRDLKNERWIVASVSDQRPAHFYLYDRSNGKKQFLFSTQPALEQYLLSKMMPISFQARDGMKLFGYLTLPAGKEAKHLPTVILVHGGPWVRDSWGLQPTVQWLANRGYAVLQINYRGSTGYGKDYLNAGNREWSRKMHTDLLDGKQWVIEQGYADPQKIAIYGGSYGGYATLVGLAFTPNEFCCGVDIVGPSNLITLFQTIPPYWSPMKSRMYRQIGNLDTEEDFLKACSPLFKADQITKPLLIAQGANDPRVKQSESDQIVTSMRSKKLPVTYLLFADEGHGFARPENRIKFFSAAEDFLSKNLGGKKEAPSSEEDWKGVMR
jgi:dipeptidyl aminopeptidase/acylaminoacyl peptidase